MATFWKKPADSVYRTCIFSLYFELMLSLGLYTWSDLQTYANRSMCTHLPTYAKFARMQKLENLHLPQTKCKSHFAYMQILHICKSGNVNANQNLQT